MTVEKRTASTYISSTWVDGASGTSYLSVSPSTEEPLGETVTSSIEQVDEAVAAAKAAFHHTSEWRSWTPQMRADAINRFADILEREMEPLSRLIASEVGTPIAACRSMQVGGPIDVLRWYATMAVKGPRGGYEQALPHYDKPVASGSLLHYEPVGVVAALSAYNYPLNLLVWKLGGALASGCTTVVLPSPQGLWSTLRVFELLDEAGLPARRGQPGHRRTRRRRPPDRSPRRRPGLLHRLRRGRRQGDVPGRPRLAQQGGPRARRQEPQHHPAQRGPARHRRCLDPAVRPQRGPGLRGLEPHPGPRGEGRGVLPARRGVHRGRQGRRPDGGGQRRRSRSSPPPTARRSRAGSRS